MATEKKKTEEKTCVYVYCSSGWCRTHPWSSCHYYAGFITFETAKLRVQYCTQQPTSLFGHATLVPEHHCFHNRQWTVPETTFPSELGHGWLPCHEFVHTYQMNWTLESSMIGSVPGPLVGKKGLKISCTGFPLCVRVCMHACTHVCVCSLRDSFIQQPGGKNNLLPVLMVGAAAPAWIGFRGQQSQAIRSKWSLCKSGCWAKSFTTKPRPPLCVCEHVCVCLTLASVTGLILVHFSESDLARDPFIRTEKSRFVFNPN